LLVFMANLNSLRRILRIGNSGYRLSYFLS
jgi:hypothetical protein